MLDQAIQFIRDLCLSTTDIKKETIVRAVSEEFDLKRHRSIYACEDYAFRFSSAKGSSFSNTVASLSAVQSFDLVPFVVCVIRPTGPDFLLANATLLKKISHSSHQLRVDNIRGSFLGHDIARELGGLANTPENFDQLFAMHQSVSWEENLERLVAATANIKASGTRFSPLVSELSNLHQAPKLAASLLLDAGYLRVKEELSARVKEQTTQILQDAKIDNVNERGNRIEQAITGGGNEHQLADMIKQVGDNIELQIEIKSKRMDLHSSPKGYNIDKMLATLAKGKTAIVFCLLGIDLSHRNVTTSVISIFDQTMLKATRTQFHWAGRNSRGVTQLTGDFDSLFSPEYQESIDVVQASEFIASLINLG